MLIWTFKTVLPNSFDQFTTEVSWLLDTDELNYFIAQAKLQILYGLVSVAQEVLAWQPDRNMWQTQKPFEPGVCKLQLFMKSRDGNPNVRNGSPQPARLTEVLSWLQLFQHPTCGAIPSHTRSKSIEIYPKQYSDLLDLTSWTMMYWEVHHSTLFDQIFLRLLLCKVASLYREMHKNGQCPMTFPSCSVWINGHWSLIDKKN